MGILLFAFWLLLNAHFAADAAMLEIVLIGLVLSGALWFFTVRFTRWNAAFDRFFLRNLHLFAAYLAVLFWNVVTANVQVIGLILRRHETPHPCFVQVEVPLKNEMLRVLLANAITLTPGTITVICNAERITVHCLQKAYIEGIETAAITKILLKMEEKMK